MGVRGAEANVGYLGSGVRGRSRAAVGLLHSDKPKALNKSLIGVHTRQRLLQVCDSVKLF